MIQLLLIGHVFIAIALIALVLMQQGKGASVGAAFGSGASSTVFGSRGSAGFLFKLTMSFGLLFFITSVGLTSYASHEAKVVQADIIADLEKK
jgi:preprotein translocase subunit SecG